MTTFDAWEGFRPGHWNDDVNVRDFIQKNYTPYDGDESFLEGPTERTDKLWGKLQELQKEERAKGGVLDMETDVVSDIDAYRQASQESVHAIRRYQDGRGSADHLWIYSESTAS